MVGRLVTTRKQVLKSGTNRTLFLCVLYLYQYIGLTNQRLPTHSSGKRAISHHALSPDHELSAVRRGCALKHSSMFPISHAKKESLILSTKYLHDKDAH
jgi:hypothetical protein